jgi:hypothetical protein
MSTLVSRRFGSPPRRIALAVVAAGLIAGVLAAVAMALPNDPVSRINSAGNTFQFAGNVAGQEDCAANQAPLTDGNLDWQESLGAGTVTPKLTGTICLQNTSHEARMVIETYDNNHVLISRHRQPNSFVGNGAALNSATVSLQTPPYNAAGMNHVHLVLEERAVGAANWNVVAPVRVADYP